jgi:hypothetical protein
LGLGQAQGETKVSKWEGAHSTPKSLSQRGSFLRRNINWNKKRFMIVYHKATREGNAVENSF